MLHAGNNSPRRNRRITPIRSQKITKMDTPTRRRDATSTRTDEDMLGNIQNHKDRPGPRDHLFPTRQSPQNDDRYVPAVIVATAVGIQTTRRVRRKRLENRYRHPPTRPPQPATTRDGRVLVLHVPDHRRRNIPPMGLGDVQIFRQTHRRSRA